MRRLAMAVATVIILYAIAPASAQDYPTRPVTIVVPFTAGGTTEILARIVGHKLEERLGKPFLVDMKPGAGTAIGSNAVAKATPDGYTLLMATSTPMAINVTLHKNLPYDPATDFVPLALVAQSPFVLVVNPDLPVKSVAELVAYAKANPGKLSYGSGGAGAPHHLFGELFRSMTGTEMTHVPYRGSLPALNDVVAGHIQFMFCDVPPSAGMIQAGRVRAIGVSTSARLPAFPDIPPVGEAGVPGFDAAAWLMLVAPAKTPRPIVGKLHNEVKRIFATPDVREKLAGLSLLPLDTPAISDMQNFVKAEILRWGKVVAQAGIAGSE
jgi:tripartite-type tricarboxylate transporter receptor subunit TctC